ncbi:hypothetical protein ACSAGD_08040 [Paramicrobacterium sp. CJ85]|uniref:hypothetical protein n=1 Tax=Paramicrobacterium sp. CJ85 TaxID=3445355 RepID=UPI003F617F88
MTTRVGVIVMSAVLLLYFVVVGQRAVMFVLTGEPAAVGIGVALIVLPLVGVWALYRELRFGAKATQLSRELDEMDARADDSLPVRPSGRIDREAADEAFPQYRDRVAADPEDWSAWFNLGLVYKGAGDSRRARHAVREAIRLHDRDMKRAGHEE